MNKTLTINSLAKSNLKHRKKQYSLMIMGILLSMIFSSTILFFLSSFFTSSAEYTKNTYGTADILMYHKDIDVKLYEDAKKNGTIENYGLAHIIGRIYPNEESESYTLNVAWLDEQCKGLYYPTFIEGAYPAKIGEIAVEKGTLDLIDPELKVGDTFTVLMKGQNADKLLDGYTEKTFKLTGILNNKRSNIKAEQSSSVDYFPSAFVYSEAEALPGTKEANVAYINAEFKNFIDWEELNPYQGEGIETFTIYLYHMNSFSYSNTFFLMILGVIFAVVMLFASFIGIINAMNSNFAQRKKQIGMLRTVGATKKQIRKIFGREAMFISLISAPVAVAVSFVIVKLISGVFGDEFVFVPNIPVLILSAVFSVFCVMLSAFIPLKAASEISPVQSIRNIDITRKMKIRKIKSQADFNVAKLLSKRNITFYRRKQVVVSLFLIATIIMSCFGFSLLEDEWKHLSSYSDKYDYNLYGTSFDNHNGMNVSFDKGMKGYTENIRQDILNISDMESVVGTKSLYGLIELDSFDDYFGVLGRNAKKRGYDARTFTSQDENGYDYDDKKNLAEYNKLKASCKTEKELFGITVVSVDSSVIEQIAGLATEGKSSVKELDSGEQVILVAPNKAAYSEELYQDLYVFQRVHSDEDINEEKWDYIAMGERSINAGDKLTVNVLTADWTVDEKYNETFTNEQLTKSDVEIAAVTNKIPESISDVIGTGGIILITTHEGMKKFHSDLNYRHLGATLNKSAKENLTEKTDEETVNMIDNLTSVCAGSWCSSTFNMVTHDEFIIRAAFMAILSCMILLLAGSMSIINNSLTARIREGKREIGTLRAVGATQKDLTMSYIRQLLSMFGWGTGIGFGIFFAIYIGIQIYGKIKDVEFAISFSVTPAVISTVILFAVCSLNLYLKIKKETKNSIIDNIREL